MKQKLAAPTTLMAGLLLFWPAGADYQVTTIENGAAISGVVTFKGTVPPPTRILIAKNTEVCGTGNREVQWVEVDDELRLRNVAVYIRNVKSGKPWQHVADDYVLDQRTCRFLPAFSAVPKGDTLRIRNSDPILHNIHMYEIVGRVRRTLFNEGQPVQGSEFRHPLRTRRSNIVKVECDAHNFMHAWIFVPDNPYYSLVDEHGRYTIDDIPPGTHEVRAWHPTLGEKRAKVTLAPGETLALDFEFSK